MNLRAKETRSVISHSIQQFREAIWPREKPNWRLFASQKALQEVRRRLRFPRDAKKVEKLDQGLVLPEVRLTGQKDGGAEGARWNGASPVRTIGRVHAKVELCDVT